MKEMKQFKHVPANSRRASRAVWSDPRRALSRDDEDAVIRTVDSVESAPLACANGASSACIYIFGIEMVCEK